MQQHGGSFIAHTKAAPSRLSLALGDPTLWQPPLGLGGRPIDVLVEEGGIDLTAQCLARRITNISA